MIRLRGGDFNYSDVEIQGMCEDVKYFKSNGADGIVFGCLNENYQIDEEKCRKILAAWDTNKPATFHRAFDETKVEDIEENVRLIASMGFTRLLTSGFECSAEQGIENLKEIQKHAKVVNLIVLPGAGVTKENAELILRETNCTEIHASARSARSIATKLSLGGEKVMICDRTKVEEICQILKSIS